MVPFLNKAAIPQGCRKYTEGLGEAYDGDIAFAQALEAFGGGHDDPISVAVGGEILGPKANCHPFMRLGVTLLFMQSESFGERAARSGFSSEWARRVSCETSGVAKVWIVLVQNLACTVHLAASRLGKGLMGLVPYNKGFANPIRQAHSSALTGSKVRSLDYLLPVLGSCQTALSGHQINQEPRIVACTPLSALAGQIMWQMMHLAVESLESSRQRSYPVAGPVMYNL